MHMQMRQNYRIFGWGFKKFNFNLYYILPYFYTVKYRILGLLPNFEGVGNSAHFSLGLGLGLEGKPPGIPLLLSCKR